MGEVEGGGRGGGGGIPQHLNKTVGAYSKVTIHSHRVGRGAKGIVSKAKLGILLRDAAERIWAFSERIDTILNWTELAE